MILYLFQDLVLGVEQLNGTADQQREKILVNF
jgi:hypothetical protein